VYYASRAFTRIGADAVAVARCGADDSSVLLPPLEAVGLPVEFRPGTSTAAFSFHYEGDHRVMEIDGLGDPWTVEDVTGWVARALDDSCWVLAGALVRSDFAAPTLAALAGSGRQLLVDAQGLVRLPQVGPLTRDAAVDPDVFEALTAIKLNEHEAGILAGGTDPKQLRALGVPEVLVTLGSAGALVVTASHAERIAPVLLEDIVDPTGAGDSFSAVYLWSRACGAEPLEAARTANAVAAELIAERS
jgi:sugar/nucleoside kinase (ribokinase family)